MQDLSNYKRHETFNNWLTSGTQTAKAETGFYLKGEFI